MRKTVAKACIAVTAMLMLQSGVVFSADSASVSFDRADLVARPEPLTIGVGVHFGIGGEYNYVAGKTAALIRDMGFGSYRDDLAWPAFDQPGAKQGRPEPKQLFDFMKLRPARPLLILGHGNPQVKEGDPPLTEAGRKAFADFAARAAAAAEPFDPIYEIWNEWNLTARFSLPFLVGPGKPDDPRAAKFYSALAKATIPAVAEAAPGAPLLVGAVGVDEGWQWTKAVVDDGAVMTPAGLSVHMYNHCEPDETKRNATELVDRLEDLQKMLSEKDGKQVPISVTEFGWPTAKKPCVISTRAQADNIAQFLLWSAATPWMKGAWVYQLKDQGRDANDLEANFGLFDYDYKPKPAACAVREVIRLVKQAKAFHLSRPMPDVFVLAMDDGKATRLAAWTTRAEIRADMSIPAGEVAKAQALCASEPLAGDKSFEIGATPVLVELAKHNSTDFSVDISIK
ncbi:hypothetical protein J2T09_000611 [Neorhizobium huautlense]|uniref:Uncharacterized protein n=1 Tax=Neorhizobium huautlense TaxID=67774 RepID=A0ABT9PQC3_9HYPH|nr:hypothetical protein [Neorhizobium huautlense]MDP9835869.1 hypothetical protein [Neorhizobium huautlense]